MTQYEHICKVARYEAICAELAGATEKAEEVPAGKESDVSPAKEEKKTVA